MMSLEKQNGIPKRRLPLSNTATERSPNWNGKGSPLPKVANSPATNDYGFGRRGSQVEGPAKGNGGSEEFVATPVKSFLSSNITPRSSARKARAETASPALNAGSCTTPENSKHFDYETPREDGRGTCGLGLRISNAGQRSRAGSVTSNEPGSYVSTKPAARQRKSSSTRLSSPEPAPKFFHVDDVKPAVAPRSISTKSSLEDQPSGYARSTESDSLYKGTLPVYNSPTQEDEKARYFKASDSTEFKLPPLRLANGNGSSRPQLQTIYSAYTASSPPRATSPLKEEVLPRKSSLSKASPRRHTRLVSNGGSELKSPETTYLSHGSLSRRSSSKSPGIARHSTHVRSSSVQSAEPSSSRRSSIAFSDGSPKERMRTASFVGVSGVLPHSVTPPSITQEVPVPKFPSRPQSPTKPVAGGQSKIDQLNELAANARRERKVLDLEISNSSLLAINRTLEREMRKQNAELRRFRRLSRSGRVSIAPSSRSASGKMSILSGPDTSIDSDDLVSSSDDDDDEDAVGGLSILSSASSTSRPSSPTSRAARARFQDPKWVELDLAAHRALLLDSQVLNTSIKRCLAHSESLISSGKQALEYQAQLPKPGLEPQPASLGGRVLTPDDIDDDSLFQGQGLLSPSLGQAYTNPWEQSLGSNERVDGGFETPDYSKWGPPTEIETPIADPPVLPRQLTRDSGSTEASSKDSSAGLSSPSPALGYGNHTASEVASLDGLDEGQGEDHSQSDEEMKGKRRPPASAETPSEESTQRPERTEKSKPPDPQPGQPGYRGSMQGLGHYLQAFSIFGTAQPT